MKLHEALDGLRRGKYIVLVHEEDVTKRTPDQFEANFVRFVDSPDEGRAFCYRRQEEEISRGETPKTYVVSNVLEEYVCVPNLTAEEAALIREGIKKDVGV